MRNINVSLPYFRSNYYSHLLMQEAQLYAEDNDLFFVETSAKTAMNVNDMFYEIGMSFYFVIIH